ncbi:MAG TPA: carotenoid 1,2-hydratase [Methylibium sp.]|nr:carotenoid 1,2-hydratase [Methylibium sp.]
MNPARRAWLLALAAAWAGGARADASAKAIALPRDFGAHPEQRIEWWYVTGWLAAPDGGLPYGFQLTFFRSRTNVAADHPSRFAAKQLLFAHAAVTDLRRGRLRHDERIARAGFGLAEAATADTDLRLRGWRLAREGPVGGHHYLARIDADGPGFGLDLRFDATQPVLLQGEAGWSRKGPEPAQASRYLSEPQLAVTGRLRLDGQALTVHGRAWLDHEWSDTLLPPDAVGWDWIGMNLADGGALTAFRLRRRDGSALWAGGSHRPRGGTVRAFGPDEVRFTPLRHWTSPATAARYPVQWRVDTPVGAYEVRARLDAQELDSRRSTGTVYWEGLSELHAVDGHAALGRGYLEMTGYAGALRL